MNKNVKRLSAILAASLLVCGNAVIAADSESNDFTADKNEPEVTVEVQAAEPGDTDTLPAADEPAAAIPAEPALGFVNFKKSNAYSAGMFSDVTEDKWYAVEVGKVYEFGMMIGNDKGEFSPDDGITVAQTLTIASRLHSIYKTGKAEFVQGNPWYEVYADYAIEQGIISAEKYASLNPDSAASRMLFAQIIASSLPAEAFAAKNTVEDNALPDVSMGMEGADSVYRLYRAGILKGNDANGTFTPDSGIKRSEVAAIIVRTADPSMRAELTLSSSSAFFNGFSILLANFNRGYHPGTAGSSLNGYAYAATFADMFTSYSPSAGLVRGMVAEAFAGMSDEEKVTFAEQAAGLLTSAKAITGEKGKELIEESGYEAVSYPWDSEKILPIFEGFVAGTITESFDDIIEAYRKAVNENWDRDRLNEAKLNYLVTSYGEDAPAMAGYLIKDLDGDGVSELMIGATKANRFEEAFIYALYSFSYETGIQCVFTSGERDRYYYAGENLFAHEGSSGWDSSFDTTVKYEKGTLTDLEKKSETTVQEEFISFETASEKAEDNN